MTTLALPLGIPTLRFPSLPLSFSNAAFRKELRMNGLLPIDDALVTGHLYATVGSWFQRALLWSDLHRPLYVWMATAWLVLMPVLGTGMGISLALLTLAALIRSYRRTAGDCNAICWKQLYGFGRIMMPPQHIRDAQSAALQMPNVQPVVLSYQTDPLLLVRRPRILAHGLLGDLSRLFFGYHTAVVDGWDTNVPAIDNHHRRA